MPKHLTIHGLVQGVGFRESMRWEANRLGINGWVRNRRNGSVEAIVDGDPDSVAAIIAWAHRGPSSARVNEVVVTETAGSFSSFELESTA